MNISAIVIAKNEQENLRDCLKSLYFAKELIVIDNGSLDMTKVAAQKYGAKIYTDKSANFSHLRNIGKEKARYDWLLYLDADERIDGIFAEFKSKLGADAAGYTFERINYYLGKKWPKNEKMLRLIRKSALIGWQGQLHETPRVQGKIIDLKCQIHHYTHKNISSMVEKTNQWSDIEAQLRFTGNHPNMSWWRFIRVMFTAFWKSYFKESGWKVGTVGLIESLYQAFSMFVTYAKLWEKQNNIKGCAELQ